MADQFRTHRTVASALGSALSGFGRGPSYKNPEALERPERQIDGETLIVPCALWDLKGLDTWLGAGLS